MNAQHIIGQISNKIFHSDVTDHGSSLSPENKYAPAIADLISRSLENDVSPELISNQALDKPMHDIVNRFRNDDYEFMEMIARAKITGDARGILADCAEEAEPLDKGTMLLATVEGEYHCHGKYIISSLSRGIGFNIIDLGTGVSAGEMLKAVDEHKPDYLGISASTRSTISNLKEIVDDIQAGHAAAKTTVILGGFLAAYSEADAIDADYRCSNIHQTLDLLLRLANSPS
jgi:methanogenic corrinoid protein MtbC1